MNDLSNHPATPVSMEEGVHVLLSNAPQGIRHRYEDYENRIRESPTKAVLGAVVVGYSQGGGMSSSGGMIVRGKEPLNLEKPFGSLEGFITPVDRFFVRHHFSIPQIDLKTSRLRIEGEI